jgi:integrase
VADTILMIAKDWLKQPPEAIAALKKLKGKLPKLTPGLTPKNRNLLATFDDHKLLSRFLNIGDELWREALADKLPRNQRLVRAQMALLIGILQITPLRRKNMCALAFGQHITWPNGPAAAALIQVPSSDMKTQINYVGELPVDLSRRLHHYRTKLIPQLIGSVPQHVFITVTGKFKIQASIANRLVYTLNRRLGLRMSMHQFRHLSGKLMLDANPGAYETVAQNLGHTGTKSVVRFYGGTDTKRASRHHGALIEKLRDEARQRGTSRGKGKTAGNKAGPKGKTPK